MMGNNDYGHFGSGSTGYAHYMQAHDSSFSNSSGPSGGCGCGGTFFMIVLPIILLYLYLLVAGIMVTYTSIERYNFGAITLDELSSTLILSIPLNIGLIALPIYKIYRFFH